MASLPRLGAPSGTLLAPAIVASLVLHAAIAVGLPGRIAAVAEAPLSALRVTLRPPPTNAAPVAATAAAVPVVVAKRAPRPGVATAPSRQPPKAVLEKPASDPIAGAPRPPPAEDGTDHTPAVANPAPPAPRHVASESSPAASAASDPIALGDYARLLAQSLVDALRYPRLAALRGWQGDVRLLLTLDRRGGLLAAQLVRSSGHEVLDAHALALVRTASLPMPPPALADRQIDVVVPIRYRLPGPA